MKKLAILLFIVALLFPYFQTQAIDTSRTNFINNRYYNNLISDDNFISINSMSVGDIQSFLASQGSFLQSYSEGGRSAAQIIYDAAHGNSIDSRGTPPSYIDNGIEVSQNTGTVNPMVLLVTMQKEQSLLTTGSYNQYKLDYAMGYGCLESGAWNPAYKGFAKQVDWAAWQLRYNFHRAEPERTWATNYKVGQTMNFDYAVTFANRATAALYRYTPHVFNGNYNFWKFFNDYFGVWYIPPPPNVIDNTPVTMSTYASSLVVGTSCSMVVNPPIGTTVYYIPCPNGSTKQVTIIRHKMGDINGDGKVDLMDLSIFATYWNKNRPAVQLANLNPDVDEQVNLLDLSLMAASWGK